MSQETDRLQSELNAANQTVLEARDAYHKRLIELDHQLRRQLEAEPVGLAYRKAHQVYIDLHDAFNKAKAEDRIQQSLGRLKHPEGTILVEWRMPRYSSQGHYSPTGKKGVLQVVRPGDEFATNRVCSRPSVGSVIVRLLRKDGSVGLNYGIYEDAWLPVGVRHPRAAQKAEL